ncbi:hypothetical protein ACSBR1_011945 [Camellia fascicularis]
MLKVIAGGGGGDGAKRKNSKQQIETRVLESIMIASFTIVTVLVILPCEYINGKRKPSSHNHIQGTPFHLPSIRSVACLCLRRLVECFVNPRSQQLISHQALSIHFNWFHHICSVFVALCHF